MNFKVGIVGFDAFLKRLNAELSGIKTRSEKGLVLAADFIRYATEHQRPLTPVDYGNLRASWFTVTAKGVHKGMGTKRFKDNPEHGLTAAKLAEDHRSVIGEAKTEAQVIARNFGPVVILGYSANYAMAVHEKLQVGRVQYRKKAKKGQKRRKGGWSRPGSGPKWLQSAMQNNANIILDIVRYNSTIK